MSDAESPTPRRRRGRYLALAALVPIGAAAAGAFPLAFPPRVIPPRDLRALAAGAENTGGFAYGGLARLRSDTALFTGIIEAPPPRAADSTSPPRPQVYVVARVEDRWVVVRADPAVDCIDTTRLASPDSLGLVPLEYTGRLERLPDALGRRVVAALNRRTPDLTDDGRDGDRWSRRQLLPVMVSSEGSVAHRARCIVRRAQAPRADSLADSARAVPVAAPAGPGSIGGPGPEDLLRVVRDRGADVAIGWLEGVLAAAPDAPAVREAEVNAVGYALLRNGRADEALALFRWNVERHPRSANAHDSLAEALETVGEFTEAADRSREALMLVDDDASLSDAFREQVRRAAAGRLERLR